MEQANGVTPEIEELISRERRARFAAEQAEARYRDLVQGIDAIVWEADAETWRFSFVSERAVTILGYPVSQWLTEPEFWPNHLYPEDREYAVTTCRKATGAGLDHHLECRLIAADGRAIWFRDNIRVVRDETGKVRQLRGVMVEITEEKQAEQHLQQRLDQLAAIYQLTNAVSRAECLEKIYAEALDCMERSLHVDRASVLLFDPDNVMRFKAWRRLSEGYRKAVEGHSPWSPDTLEPDPILVPNVEDEPGLGLLRPVIRAEGIRALAFIPLTARGRLIGKFMLYYETPHLFSPEEVRLAQTIATHVAFGIERKRAEDDLQRVLAEVQDLYDHAPCGYHSLDRDGVIVRINETELRWLGYAREEVVGKMKFADLLSPKSRRRFRGRFTTFLRRGQARDVEYEMIRKDGSLLPVLLNATAIYDPAGNYVMSRTTIFDITERKRIEAERAKLLGREQHARSEAEAAQRRLAFLARASQILASSLSYQTTLEQVAHLAVPVLADWCVVDVVEENGSISRLATAHADPAKEALVEELRRFPPDPDLPFGVPQVLRTGTPLFYPEVPEIPEALRPAMSQSPEHFQIFWQLQAQSALIVPLAARGRILGAITFSYSESGRRYTPADLTLTMELADRAAVAMDNARLYQAQKEISRTLQQSLLPPELPEIPGVDLAACYRPAGEGLEVGGDFYDLFETSEGAWILVIGDVTGKGAAAATVAALIRYTIRALAMRLGAPSQILASLNEVLVRQEIGGSFCTVACLRLEPAGERTRLLLACGGHPPALLLRLDGSVTEVDAPGILLGAFPGVKLANAALDLQPGNTLILYTDGVTEARTDHELYGEDRLAALVHTCAGLEARYIVERIDQAVMEFQDGIPRDDIAILVLRIPA